MEGWPMPGALTMATGPPTIFTEEEATLAMEAIPATHTVEATQT